MGIANRTIISAWEDCSSVQLGKTCPLRTMVLVSEYSDFEAADDAKSLGNLAFQKKDYKQAISQYTKAIQINQDTSLHVYYSNRAACHLALKDWARGLEDATHCVAIHPGFVKGHLRRIVALTELGKLEEARVSIEQLQQMEGISQAELVDASRLEEVLSNAETQEESIQFVPSSLGAVRS